MNEKQIRARRLREYLREARKRGDSPHSDGFYHRILGMHEIRAGQTFQFTHVRIHKDDPQVDGRLVMVQMAKDLLTQALRIDGYDPALSFAIRAAIQGEPPVFHWLGEFFQNWGVFQAKYGVFKTRETRDQLTESLADHAEDAWYDEYLDGRKSTPVPERVPLPFAVRNVLAHPEHSNSVTYAQIRRATEILAELNQDDPPQIPPR
ncbi:MAG: hypothetical protein OXJ90_26760 [Spirochaetaceae bacterium]|nr:hypothetical protein [Spirochaetaceae bacterium]